MHSLRSRIASGTRRSYIVLALLIVLPLIGVAAYKIGVAAAPCPCTVFSGDPTVGTANDSGGIEVGFKFRSSGDGFVTGVRFYKAISMLGTHTGSLWDADGNRIATATFVNETGSGWQQVNFSSPVAVTANTIYTASVFHANGEYAFTSNYFTSDIVSAPLTAPQSGSAADNLGNTGNGVFNDANVSSYPSSSFGAANYWVDISFEEASLDPPVILNTNPVADATDLALGESIVSTFDMALDASTVSSATFGVKDDQGSSVPGTVTYDAPTRRVTFVAIDGFQPGKTYTATAEGGSGGIESLSGVPLAVDFSWSFSTQGSDPCPCTFKGNEAPVGSTTADDSGDLEIGTKFRPQTNGYVTAIRFYKPIISSETTHTGQIWNASGTSLGTATFTDESAYGWQEASLSSPVRVYKDQTYIVSYGTTTAVYQSSSGGLSSTLTSGYLKAFANGSSENAATGNSNGNGVFGLTAGAYPDTASGSGNYYWVDPVFSTQSNPDETLTVTLTQPKNNAYAVKSADPIRATLSRALNAATVSASTVRLFDSSNAQVTGTPAYDSETRQISFAPTSALSANETYVMRLSATIADTDGQALGTEYSWTFTVGSPLMSDPNEGPGGPILVVTTAGNNYGNYYAEILRTEGLNLFDTADISTVNTTLLNNFDAVILGEMALTQSQADMFTSWVTEGGDLIAMRPDKKLAGLLGLNDEGSTRANQYLLVDDSTTAGAGIVDETMQFKGTADNYTVNGATEIARLYSSATTSTSHPAVTQRAVGSKNGSAVAFTYDLARSVIGLHQGNQSWAGQNRDGADPIRTNDLFYGARTGDVQPDWIDLDKLQIPQADEQQRLFANLLIDSTRDKRPLPRFWYLPGDTKAALVMAGDDHGLTNDVGTERILNNWLNESAASCSVMDWECVRATHLTYASSALTNTRAVQFYNQGFDIGAHISNAEACVDFTSFAQLSSLYTTGLGTWRAKYSGLPNQRTHRFHCYLWSDWDSMSRVENANGMRYELNYVAFPTGWIGNRTPLFTSSGMNMRFTDANGAMIDTYQGVTHLDNTVAGSGAIGALLDNAIGSAGYYGLFGTHYDMTGDSYDNTLFTAAKARNIPMISADQALTWKDGVNSSSFTDFTGEAGQFGFTVHAAEGAYGLRTMLPYQDAGGTLNSLKRDGSTVSYQTQTIKGVQYAVFDGRPGEYQATYSDYVPPTTPPTPGPGGGDDGGSSSGGAGSSSGTGAGKKTASRGDTSAGPEDDSAEPTNPAPDESGSAGQDDKNTSGGNTADRDKGSAQPSSDTSGWPWLLALLFVLLGAGLWWFVAARRRQKQPVEWQ